MKNTFTRYHEGIGLLELMLVLAIISSIILLATRYYSIVNTTRQVNDTVADIHVIGAALQEYWDDRYSFKGVNMQSLLSYDYLQPRYQTNKWGGTVDIKEITSNNNIAQLTLNTIPLTVCLNLANQFNLDGTKACLNQKSTNFSICYDATKSFVNCSAK